MMKNVILAISVIGVVCVGIFIYTMIGGAHQTPASLASGPARVWNLTFGYFWPRHDIKNLLLQYNAQIDFYGRIIDGNGKPLKGAKVSYDIQLAGDLQPELGLQRKDVGVVDSRDDGMFQILDKKGMNLYITTIELQGYREVKGGTGRGYSYGSGAEQHHPDPAHPVDFLLVNKDVPDSLTKDFKLAFAWDSKPVTISIGDPEVVIEFVAKRNRPVGAINNFDWSVDISMAQGELLRLPKGTALIAPLNGYQKSISYKSLANDPEWSDGFGREIIAFRSMAGKYGRIEMNLYADRDDDRTAAYVTIYLNESGGRNLE